MTCLPRSLPTGVAVLHVDDPSAPVPEDMEPFLLDPAGFDPGRLTNERVRRDLIKICEELDPLVAPILDQRPENLTGLIGAASTRRPLPPQMPARHPAPLGNLSKQRG